MFYIRDYAVTLINAQKLIDRVESWHLTKIPSQFKNLTTIGDINLAVNAFEYKIDPTDHWKSPDAFFDEGFGDCEDYCIAKYALLHSLLGLSSNQMCVLVGEDIDRQMHALLLVYKGSEVPVLILDNRTSLIHNTEHMKWFRPIFAVNEDGVWLYS